MTMDRSAWLLKVQILLPAMHPVKFLSGLLKASRRPRLHTAHKTDYSGAYKLN